MYSILFSENTNKAKFIKNGLYYENFFIDTFPLSYVKQELEDIICKIDGLFIYTSQFETLEMLIDTCLKIKNIPIMILSEYFDPVLIDLANKKRKINCFYLRPFPFRLMASEMRTNIFQYKEQINDPILKIRHLELNRSTHEIKINDHSIYLRNKEFALLEFLMMNMGKVLSRTSILENVWDRNADIFTNTVDVHINKLRKKIEVPFEQKFIRTIPCSGYIIA